MQSVRLNVTSVVTTRDWRSHIGLPLDATCCRRLKQCAYQASFVDTQKVLIQKNVRKGTSKEGTTW